MIKTLSMILLSTFVLECMANSTATHQSSSQTTTCYHSDSGKQSTADGLVKKAQSFSDSEEHQYFELISQAAQLGHPKALESQCQIGANKLAPYSLPVVG